MCGAECSVGFDDSGWDLIDAPHDYIVTLPITNSSTNNAGSGFFPRANAVYRKHFALPTDWKDDYVYLRFEGVYRVAYVYLNGAFLLLYGGTPDNAAHGSSDGAYTDFEVRLDNQTRTTYGTAAPNTLAVFVDGSYGTEHWYAGAGLYRSVHLVRTSKVHLDAGALYFVPKPSLPPSAITGAGQGRSLTAPATVTSTVTVVNDGSAGSGSANVTVTLQVFDSDEMLVANTTARVDSVAAGAAAVLQEACWSGIYSQEYCCTGWPSGRQEC